MHCDSFGDAVHFLNDENIEKANLPDTNQKMILNAQKFKCGACGNDTYRIFKQEDNDQELFAECTNPKCSSITVIGFTQPRINLGWHGNGDGIMAIF